MRLAPIAASKNAKSLRRMSATASFSPMPSALKPAAARAARASRSACFNSRAPLMISPSMGCPRDLFLSASYAAAREIANRSTDRPFAWHLTGAILEPFETVQGLPDFMAPASTSSAVNLGHIISGIQRWVEHESPTRNTGAVNRMIDIVQSDVVGLPGRFERIPGRDGYADNFIVRGEGADEKPGIVM